MSRASSNGAPPSRQCAALPFRRRADHVEFLLVTSRGAGRWLIPKGWPIRGLDDHDAAAREAYEEAGLRGRIVTTEALGTYRSSKRRGRFVLAVEVTVFLFEVAEQLAKWPEKSERRTRWLDGSQAASLVSDPGLAEILRGAARRLTAPACP